MRRLLIAIHVGEVAVEMRGYQEEKAPMRERAESKGDPNLYETNMTYLCRLSQVVDHTSLLTMCKMLVESTKRQQVTTL